MSVFSQLFGSELERKQDEVFVNEIIETVSELLARKDLTEEIIVTAINTMLCKWAKDKDSIKLINVIFDKLISTYPQLHAKYHFQKPTEIN